MHDSDEDEESAGPPTSNANAGSSQPTGLPRVSSFSSVEGASASPSPSAVPVTGISATRGKPSKNTNLIPIER